MPMHLHWIPPSATLNDGIAFFVVLTLVLVYGVWFFAGAFNGRFARWEAQEKAARRGAEHYERRVRMDRFEELARTELNMTDQHLARARDRQAR